MAMGRNMNAMGMRGSRRPRVNPAMRTRGMGARGRSMRAMNARPRRPMGNRARMMRSQRGMM